MQHLHERLLEDVLAERHRLSRRRLLTGAITAGGGATLAMTISTMPGLPGMRGRAAAQELTTDLAVLNYALTLEHLAYAFYRDGVGLFAFGGDSRGASIDANLAALRDQEGAHVASLTQIIIDLGGEPVAEATYDFGGAYGDPLEFLATAMALEDIGVSAYDGACHLFSDPALVTATGTIVAVEARHASYLSLLNGELPFPEAFETPIAPETVLEITGPFIAS